MIYNTINNKFLMSLNQIRAETIQSIQDVNNIDELNMLIGDDDISEEEYQDMVNYIIDKNKISNNSEGNEG